MTVFADRGTVTCDCPVKTPACTWRPCPAVCSWVIRHARERCSHCTFFGRPALLGATP